MIAGRRPVRGAFLRFVLAKTAREGVRQKTSVLCNKNSLCLFLQSERGFLLRGRVRKCLFDEN